MKEFEKIIEGKKYLAMPAKNVDEAAMKAAGWKQVHGVWYAPITNIAESDVSARLALRPTLTTPTIAESRAAASTVSRKNIVEGYQLLGMSADEAEIAAGPLGASK
jgi:hypothetical protein